MKAKAAFYFLILCRQLLSQERYRRKKSVAVNPILHTWIRDGCLHMMVPQPYGFSLGFFTEVWQFNHTKVLFQMGEGHAATQRGGGLPVMGGGGKSADS